MAGIITVLSIPVFGIIMDKIDQRKFGSIMFSFMLLYVISIMLTDFFPQSFMLGGSEVFVMLILAFLFFGIFNAVGTLSWNVSSVYFSKDINSAGDYQAVHITLTGIRSLFAPVGVLIYHTFGYTKTFAFSIVFILLALVILWLSQRRQRLG